MQRRASPSSPENPASPVPTAVAMAPSAPILSDGVVARVGDVEAAPGEAQVEGGVQLRLEGRPPVAGEAGIPGAGDR